jgi:hypothetical protein
MNGPPAFRQPEHTDDLKGQGSPALAETQGIHRNKPPRSDSKGRSCIPRLRGVSLAPAPRPSIPLAIRQRRFDSPLRDPLSPV